MQKIADNNAYVQGKTSQEPLTDISITQHTLPSCYKKMLLNISLQSIPWQIILFGLVGIANTTLDFLIYNLLTKRIPRISANICSTTIAMTFSFSANFFVFQPNNFNAPDQVSKFIIVTAISLYFIQNIVIYLTTYIWKRPTEIANKLSKRINMTKNWNESFVSKNTVKLMATGCSLTWNFLWYRYYVYL